MPKEEIYNLVSQMRRAATSIPSNIAEGNGRKTSKDYSNFLHIAGGSARGLETQIIIAKRIYPKIDFLKAEALLTEILKMITAINKKLSVPN